MGRWHAAGVKKAGGDLLAVADLNPDAAKRLAAAYPDVKPYANFEEMHSMHKLNVLHVCTPLSTHKKIAETAIKAGINLIMEKPFTAEAGETEYLYDMAQKHNLLACPVHQFIFQNGVRKGFHNLSRIGKVVHIAGVFSSAGGEGLSGEKLDDIVSDILPHPLSIMQAFLPGGVEDTIWTTMRPAPGEFRATGKAPDTSLSIFISMNARPTVCAFEISGTKGTMHMDLFHGFSFFEPGQVSRARKMMHPFDLSARRLYAGTVNLLHRTLRWEPAYPGLNRLINSFYCAVRGEEKVPISREDSIAVARAREILTRTNQTEKETQ